MTFQRQSLLLLLLLMGTLGARAQSLSWGSASSKGCARCFFRTYTAKLNGIPSGQKWEDYCPGEHCNLSLLAVLGKRIAT